MTEGIPISAKPKPMIQEEKLWSTRKKVVAVFDASAAGNNVFGRRDYHPRACCCPIVGGAGDATSAGEPQ
ncbi:hypothetical protein [Paraburkholderia bannensis]|uniref:hypothetical protein n=1 Tax=Paraburkholderia bannensis TaxID=765414 RepID=UPI002AB6E744|nr:hypothetical protein [Paraburkholderia bannensis]